MRSTRSSSTRSSCRCIAVVSFLLLGLLGSTESKTVLSAHLQPLYTPQNFENRVSKPDFFSDESANAFKKLYEDQYDKNLITNDEFDEFSKESESENAFSKLNENNIAKDDFHEFNKESELDDQSSATKFSQSAKMSDQTENDAIFSRQRKADWKQEEDCQVHLVEHIHVVMDRLCLMCHESFSHLYRTLRSDCRTNCFDNVWFRKCLDIYEAPRSSRR